MDVQEEIVHSRLVFMDGEQELGRLFVSSGERSFTPPAVEERPGQHFAGWATRGQRHHDSPVPAEGGWDRHPSGGPDAGAHDPVCGF